MLPLPHTDWNFEISRTAAGLQLAGELDCHALEGLRGMLESEPGPVRLDLSELTFADVAAVRELARLRARGSVILESAGRRVRRVFALLGLEEALDRAAASRGLCRGLDRDLSERVSWRSGSHPHAREDRHGDLDPSPAYP